MFRSIGRVAAAAVLVLSTVAITAVVSNSSAGAANTNITANCSGSGTSQTINNSDTITFTVGTGCGAVILMSGSGSSGTAVINGSFPINTGAPSGGLAQGDTVTFTAPAVGSGSMSVGFMQNAQSPPAITFPISYPIPAPRNDALTDNGDGSMTLVYSPVTSPQSVWVSLFPSGTTCNAQGNPTGRLYLIGSNSVLTSSPTVIAAGSPAQTGTQPLTATTVAAGTYTACLYYYNGQQQTSLTQSLTVTLGVVTPTTAPADDPVVPAFTG